MEAVYGYNHNEEEKLSLFSTQLIQFPLYCTHHLYRHLTCEVDSTCARFPYDRFRILLYGFTFVWLRLSPDGLI